MASPTRKAMLRRFKAVRKNLAYCVIDLTEVGVTYDAVAPELSVAIAEIITALELITETLEIAFDTLSSV